MAEDFAEGFTKYSTRNFAKRLDKFRSKRVGTVKIRHLVMERAPYDLLKFKIVVMYYTIGHVCKKCPICVVHHYSYLSAPYFGSI